MEFCFLEKKEKNNFKYTNAKLSINIHSVDCISKSMQCKVQSKSMQSKAMV